MTGWRSQSREEIAQMQARISGKVTTHKALEECPPEARKGTAKPRTADRPERDIQKDILALLERHPKVAWVRRMNVGMSRGIKFGFIGCADLLGQMKDGRLLAIEVKRQGQGPNLPQQNFIAQVRMNNGVAGIARSVDDALRIVLELKDDALPA